VDAPAATSQVGFEVFQQGLQVRLIVGQLGLLPGVSVLSWVRKPR
jgi:hypothetical protein